MVSGGVQDRLRASPLAPHVPLPHPQAEPIAASTPIAHILLDATVFLPSTSVASPHHCCPKYLMPLLSLIPGPRARVGRVRHSGLAGISWL